MKKETRELRNLAIQQLSDTRSVAQIAEIFGMSRIQVYNILGKTPSSDEGLSFRPRTHKARPYHTRTQPRGRSTKHDDTVKKMWNEHTLNEIGQKCGVTRERVRQIGKILGLTPRRYLEAARRQTILTECVVCSRPFEIYVGQSKKACSKECRKKLPRKTPIRGFRQVPLREMSPQEVEAYRAYNRERGRMFYARTKDDPEYIKKRREYQHLPHVVEYRKKWGEKNKERLNERQRLNREEREKEKKNRLVNALKQRGILQEDGTVDQTKLYENSLRRNQRKG